MNDSKFKCENWTHARVATTPGDAHIADAVAIGDAAVDRSWSIKRPGGYCHVNYAG